MSTFQSLYDIAVHLQTKLQEKKYILLFAYNTTGKTRLSMEFKNLRQDGEPDTLYFNAHTEDLFIWQNDFGDENNYKLIINTDSRFITEALQFELETRIRNYLHHYIDIDFEIDYETYQISFSRNIKHLQDDGSVKTEEIGNIKISRAEETIFIWSIFLAILELAADDDTDAYNWTRYIFIDDPVSSLDENYAIALATDLARILKQQDRLKAVISTHHTLFFNILYNELRRAVKYVLSKHENKFLLKNTGDTPNFYHVAMLKELQRAAQTGPIYTYHFNILRSILEKTAAFHGYTSYGDLLKDISINDPDGIIYRRLVALLSHGNYSVFEPIEMLDENKEYFREILNHLITKFEFNPKIFEEQ